MNVDWDHHPPSAVRRSHARVLRLRPGQQQQVCLLGPLVGVWLHWAPIDGERRSLPHLTAGCRHCQRRLFRRWYGPALIPDRRDGVSGRWSYERVVVELNDVAYAELEGEDLDRLIVVLRRGLGRRAPVLLAVRGQCLCSLPCRAWPVEPDLYALWGLRPGEASLHTIHTQQEDLPFGLSQ